MMSWNGPTTDMASTPLVEDEAQGWLSWGVRDGQEKGEYSIQLMGGGGGGGEKEETVKLLNSYMQVFCTRLALRPHISYTIFSYTIIPQKFFLGAN